VTAIASVRVCRWPGCNLEVATFMCEPHWRALPMALQQRIRAGWQAEAPESPASLRVLYELAKWIGEEFGGEAERDRRGRWARLGRYVRDRDAKRGRALVAEPVDSPAPRRAAVQLRLVP
jgi:hypothetical protein